MNEHSISFALASNLGSVEAITERIYRKANVMQVANDNDTTLRLVLFLYF